MFTRIRGKRIKPDSFQIKTTLKNKAIYLKTISATGDIFTDSDL